MLKNGYTLMHEHTIIDLSSLKNDDCNFNDFDAIVTEYKKLYDLGVRNIVDVTNIGMGRDLEYLKKVAKETNINIICATGYYQDKFLPEFINTATVEEISEVMIKEITDQIENSGVKAQIIGEIGTSKNLMTPNEEKVFEAAVIAHQKTNTNITTHCTLGTYGLEQVEFFKNRDVDLSKVVIGHVDLTGDIDYILALLETGVYVEFDTVGKNNYMSDEVRIECLKVIEAKGYTNRVFLSLDITRKSNLQSYGGIGYSYLFDVFLVDCLKAGISQSFIDQMLITNPQEFFNKEKNV